MPRGFHRPGDDDDARERRTSDQPDDRSPAPRDERAPAPARPTPSEDTPPASDGGAESAGRIGRGYGTRHEPGTSSTEGRGGRYGAGYTAPRGADGEAEGPGDRSRDDDHGVRGGGSRDDRSSGYRDDRGGGRYGGGGFDDRRGRGSEDRDRRGGSGGFGRRDEGRGRSFGDRDDRRDRGGYGDRRRGFDTRDGRGRGFRDDRRGPSDYRDDRRDRGGYDRGGFDDRGGRGDSRRDDRRGASGYREDRRGQFDDRRDRGGYGDRGRGFDDRRDGGGYDRGGFDDRGPRFRNPREARPRFDDRRVEDRGDRGYGRDRGYDRGPDRTWGRGYGRDRTDGYREDRRRDRGGWDDRPPRADRRERDGGAASSRGFDDRSFQTNSRDTPPGGPRRFDDRRADRQDGPVAPQTPRSGKPKRSFAPPTPPNLDPAQLDEPIRLNKYIARSTRYSRKQADELVRAGRVTVNDDTPSPGLLVQPGDVVLLDEKPLQRRDHLVYLLVNKPKDVAAATTAPEPADGDDGDEAADAKPQRTLADVLKFDGADQLAPVLPLAPEMLGLQLLTNDEAVAAHLAAHPPLESYTLLLEEGGDPLLPTRLVPPEGEGEPVAGIEVAEYVGEDLERLSVVVRGGLPVEALREAGVRYTRADRLHFAGLTKKDLPRGHWRYLSEREVTWVTKFQQ